jgi:hypothetical protein
MYHVEPHGALLITLVAEIRLPKIDLKRPGSLRSSHIGFPDSSDSGTSGNETLS